MSPDLFGVIVSVCVLLAISGWLGLEFGRAEGRAEGYSDGLEAGKRWEAARREQEAAQREEIGPQ